MEVWKKPQPGWFRVNTDGATDAQDKLAVSGVVIRDDSGGFRCCKLQKIWSSRRPSWPLIIEALACRDGVQAAVDRGLSHVVLETV